MLLALLVTALATSACGSSSGSEGRASTEVETDGTGSVGSGAAGTATAVDATHLPVGDGEYGSSATVGTIFSCQTTLTGGGAFATGSWVNGDGTFDLAKKPSVDGDVSWPGAVTFTKQGSTRLVTSNGVPDSHATGVFPIASTDDAFSFDRNPNRITAQSVQLSLPADPVVAPMPTCLGMGTIGVMTTGVALFNGLDAGGRDAVAHEIQDHCAGHPQMQGVYHYHSGSDCFSDPGTGHSALLGYALDGFGIYGSRGENGAELSTADLDECHGHTHTIEWDGVKVSMYHHHLSADFPYTLSCYRGTPVSVAGTRQ
jgi:hypothetical protein